MSRTPEAISRSHERLPMRRPVVALVLFFGAGILLKDALDLANWLGWLIAGIFSITAAVLAIAHLGGVLRFLLWAAALAGLGLVRGGLTEIPEPPPADSRVVVSGVARSGWERHQGMLRLKLEVGSVRPPGGQERALRIGMRLTVRQDHEAESDCPQVLPGDDVLALMRVRLPRSARNPGTVDTTENLARRNIHWVGSVRSCEEVWIKENDTSFSLLNLSERMREGILRSIRKCQRSEAARGILAALTVGERGLIPQVVRDRFQAAGLSHLLAISGLHLGFVALGLYFLFCNLLVRVPGIAQRLDARRLAALVVIPIAVFYTLLAGAHLPAVRACIMVLCFLLSVVLRRDADSVQTLAASALIILGVWPQSLFEASFLLSFSAVLFIILGVPRLARWLGFPLSSTQMESPWYQRWKIRLVYVVLVSVAATLGTAPLVARFFNQVSLVGPLVNLLAVPLACWMVVPLGLLASLLLPVSTWLAGGLIDLALWPADLLVALTSVVGGWSWSSMVVVTPSVLELIAWYVGLLALILSFPKEAIPSSSEWLFGRRARWVALLACLLLGISWGAKKISHLCWDQLKITFIDVRQGDSILVKFPSGKLLLVDGGQAWDGGFDTGRWVVAPFLWGQGIDRLDFVAVTHRESDHAGGLESIVRLFRPQEIWANAPLEEVTLTHRLLQVAGQAGSRIRVLRAGDQPYSEEDYEVSVLWPDKSAADLGENERSLVLRITHKQYAVLLTGDLEKEGEARLLGRDVDLSADVLKLGHHGSQGATSLELLDRVKPRYGVISVGADNRHGLPHPKLMERLDEAGVRVFRTDHHGAISLEFNQTGLEIESWVEP